MELEGRKGGIETASLDSFTINTQFCFDITVLSTQGSLYAFQRGKALCTEGESEGI